MLHEKNAFETFVFFVQHQLLEDSIHIRFQGTFHISLKICVPLFQAPFENISNNDHTNICRDILNILIRGNDSGTDNCVQSQSGTDVRYGSMGSETGFLEYNNSP